MIKALDAEGRRYGAEFCAFLIVRKTDFVMIDVAFTVRPRSPAAAFHVVIETLFAGRQQSAKRRGMGWRRCKNYNGEYQ